MSDIPAPPAATVGLHPRIPSPPSAARALLDGASADARAFTAADGLVKAGFSVEQVREALGDPEYEPDTRSAAQRQHDDLHGVEDLVDANAFRYSLPHGVELDPAQAGTIDQAVRDLVADTGFAPSVGASFIRQAFTAANAVNNADDKPAMLQRWKEQLEALYPTERINAASDQIVAMLGLAGDNAVLAELKSSGLLRHPTLFTMLMHRAAEFHLWKSTRPK